MRAGLPQDVGDDDHGVVLLQVYELAFDVLAGLGIEGRCRFVAEDDLGADRQAARQAESLLLADRKP